MIIGLDVGGTNTDVVLIGNDRILRQTKVPTDHSNLFESVWTGLDEITRDVPSESIGRAVLSTTLTTNAIVEKKALDAILQARERARADTGEQPMADLAARCLARHLRRRGELGDKPWVG